MIKVFADAPPRLEKAGAPEAEAVPLAGRRGRPSSGDDAEIAAPPLQVLVGWLGGAPSRRDVIEHARGLGAENFATLETAWFDAVPFLDGALFEIHEGGGGRGHLADIAEALSRDPGQTVWLSSGTARNRAITVSIAEGRVRAVVLTEAESETVRRSGRVPMRRSGRMRRLTPAGRGVLATGAALFAVAAVGLLVAVLHVGLQERRDVALRPYVDDLPHRRIVQLAEALRTDRWVSEIVFEEGAWRADFRETEVPILPLDDAEARAAVEAIMQGAGETPPPAEAEPETSGEGAR